MSQEIYLKDMTIAVVGLGYVGLPLFCQLSTSFPVIGYDVDTKRIEEIKKGLDSKKSVTKEQLYNALSCNEITTDIDKISTSKMVIVTVPTPITNNFEPDTSALENVCLSLSNVLRKGSIVVFESTIYPGATEELCVPLLCKSGLRYNVDFFVGYSPERINVGDMEHQIKDVSKIVSGSTTEVTNTIASVYQTILSKSVVVASCIKVAEAAKMYENVQRDLLIALANEYSEYCDRENINIDEVTLCASSKWNFSNVRPGLVGGHCIGVDPYYLLQRASTKGMNMSLIRNARQINENKPLIVAEKIKNHIRNLKLSECAKILLLGFSYKPNSGDIRNTKVAVVLNELTKQGFHTDCFDPLVNNDEVLDVYGLRLLSAPIDIQKYDLVVVMVEHDVFASTILACDKKNIIKLRTIL